MRVHLLRSMALAAALLAAQGCDDLESKARDSNAKHEKARKEVQATLLPMAAKALPSIVPVTIDLRVDETGKITKCLSNRQELPGCVGMQLKAGENSAYSFTMEEVAETRKVDKLKEDAPAK